MVRSGITFQVDYEGGDGCVAGRAALAKVLQAVHTEPPQYQQVPGTVLTEDPCAVADKKAVATALRQKTFVEPKSLHECDLWSGDGSFRDRFDRLPHLHNGLTRLRNWMPALTATLVLVVGLGLAVRAAAGLT